MYFNNMNFKITIFVLGAFLSFAFMYSFATVDSARAMKTLSEEEMGSVTAKEGLLMDFSMKASVGNFDFIDADGVDGDQGRLRFSNFAVGGGSGANSVVDLTGITVDFDSATTVGAVNQGAMVVGLPSMELDFAKSSGSTRTGGGFGTFLGSTASPVGGMKIDNLNLAGSTLTVSNN